MELREAKEKKISGLTARTSNADEMNPATARIGRLWREFDKSVAVDYRNGNRVYAVYYEYASDANGEYTVLAGTDQQNARSARPLETTVIPAGKYLVFRAAGEVPEIVLQTWGRVWEYFSRKDAEYERSYQADFEYYVNQNEIEIHIGVR